MTDSYTKLFASITESTIWAEPASTRLVWITLLAKCNRDGEMFASVPGLAKLANVGLGECEAALSALQAPDQWSRTKTDEGRRIEEIDGGWRLINHAKYRDARSTDERREYMAEYMRKYRAVNTAKANKMPQTGNVNNSVSPGKLGLAQVSPSAPAPAPTPSPTEQEQKRERCASASGTRLPQDWKPSDADLEWAQAERPDVDAGTEAAKFADYWHATPGAKGRKSDWPATWRNWIRRADASRFPLHARGSPPSKTMQAIQNINRVIANGTANTKLPRLDAPRAGHGPAEAALPAPGRTTGG